MVSLRDRDGWTSIDDGKKQTERAGEPRPAGTPRWETGREVREVRAGCIGRGQAGKTALFRALTEGPVGDFFPSGLHVDVGDPKEVAQMIRVSEETQRLLQDSGLPPTLEASQIRYYLYDGDQQRVVYKMREVIGQVLTHTVPDSAPEHQALYEEYLKTLVNTHVLWVVIPCPPPNPTPRDRRRYANDLRIATAYLREALRLRVMDQPVAVAIVISKIDTLFRDPEEAHAALTGDVLRSALGPLVHLVEQSSHVSDAVVIPVTAFGFGNAVLREHTGGRPGAPEAPDDPFGAEPIWLLREDAVSQPYNLDTLVLWTLFYGLLSQDRQRDPEHQSDTAELCRLLEHDLLAEDHWFLPLKSELVVT